MVFLHRLSGIAMAGFIATGTLSAQEMLNDNFNGENGGSTYINYDAFANWNVSGKVDLVKSPNNFSIVCAGSCVDLDGSRGPGAITTKLAYEFFAGDRMRFDIDVSGSQVRSAFDQFLVGFGFSAPTSISGFTSTTAVAPVSAPANNAGEFSNLALVYNLGGNQAFSTWTYEFTAETDGAVQLSLGTSSADNIGPIVDNVVIERFEGSAAVVPEPASAILLGAGLLGLVGIARRRSIA